MTKLIVDTTCDLNPAIKDRYEFEVIPLSIILNDKPYEDGVEIQTEEVYEAMRSGLVPKTSQVSYKSVVTVFEKLIQEGSDFIFLTFSSQMSGTYGFARGILSEYSQRYPERRMAIVDSAGGSGGATLMALQILQMMEKQVSFDRILENIEHMKAHLQYHFTLPSIEWLAKGGRVNRGVGYLGDKLDLKPILTVQDGRIIMDRMVRGRKKALKTILEDTLVTAAPNPAQWITISHAHDPEAAEDLKAKILSALPQAKVEMMSLGAVLGAHIGIGGIGIFALSELPPDYQF